MLSFAAIKAWLLLVEYWNRLAARKEVAAKRSAYFVHLANAKTIESYAVDTAGQVFGDPNPHGPFAVQRPFRA